MQINLTQAEIHTALTEFINKDFDLSGQDVRITLVAGRGKKGHSASIDILPAGTLDAEVAEETQKPKKVKEEEVDGDSAAIDFTK